MQTLLKIISEHSTILNVSPNSLELNICRKVDRDGEYYKEVSICFEGELLESTEYYDFDELELEIGEIENLFPNIEVDYI